MLFNSYEFIFFFLPVTLGIALWLKGDPLLRFLTFSSLAFYAMAGHAWFVIPMIFTTCVDYGLAFAIDATAGPRKKAWLLMSLGLNLGLLCYFKFNPFSQSGLILPAGISFYTFQTMSYVIDVYRGEARPERNFWKFATFVSFFPHLVAGPLTRHDQLIPALGSIAGSGPRPRWKAGVFLFSLGLFKKVILGDQLAASVNTMYPHLGQLGALHAWLSLLGFALQIYFDFSGYSDMAIGLGRMFGVELPLNFDSPYQASSPADFWKRWHITLSAWLRDYVYIPLGGNRQGRARQAINLLLTMFLGGLWHGAGWTFALWGLFHGVLLIAYHLGQATWDRLPMAAKKFMTFTLVSLGWVLFRSHSVSAAAAWYGSLFGARGLLGYGLEGHEAEVLALAILVPTGFLICLATREFAKETEMENYGQFSWAALGILAGFTILKLGETTRFLYFQF